MPHPSPPSRSLRINKLFEANRAVDEPEESNATVARAIANLLKQPVSSEDIADLRAGIVTGPDEARLVRALASYFDAPASFLDTVWDNTAEKYDRELSLLVRMRDSGVRLLAMRDGGGGSIENDLIDILKQLPEQVVSERTRPFR